MPGIYVITAGFILVPFLFRLPSDTGVSMCFDVLSVIRKSSQEEQKKLGKPKQKENLQYAQGRAIALFIKKYIVILSIAIVTIIVYY